MIQSHQTARRIGTAPAHAAADRNSLQQTDVGAERRAGCLFQGTRGAYAQIRLRRQTGYVEHAANLPVRAHLKGDFIAQVDELKTGLQLVIAIAPPPDDVQKSVELRGTG